MTFKKLSEYFQLLEQNTSRLKITAILADLFKECSEEEIDKVCYLSLGRLLPQYQGIEFQMAQKMMEKAVAKAFETDLKKVKIMMQNLGDLGEVGEEIKGQMSKVKSQKLFEDIKTEKNLEVLRVYERLLEIAKESGFGSVDRKVSKMAALLQDLDGLSVRFVVRMPLGKMRMGFSEMTILDALSFLLKGDKSLRSDLEDAYNVVADVGEIAKKVKSDGLKFYIKPKLGTPIMPALCQRIGTSEEIIEKLGQSAIEPKYDGTRLQVHIKGEMIRIFTRNLENVTQMFPEIVSALRKEVNTDEAIFDGEGVGVDSETGKYLPFQETIKRKRKYEIKETAKGIPIKYFVFDILYKDGESLIKVPFSKRRSILEKTIGKNTLTIMLSPQIIIKDAQELKKYYDEQIANGLEGVVIKKWQSFYEPGRRGFKWVKLKQDETRKGGKLADTIDCVVMGVSRGKGKRADFGVGSFLVGIKKASKFITITNIGTGLSDDQFRELDKRSKKLKVKEKPNEYLVDKNQEPETWLKPDIVVEIQADNITKSPIHTAGLSLRFPRLIRFRDDRSADQATSLKEVERLFEMQYGNHF